MSNGNADKPKFIVDSDWKAQAQAERERLASQQQAAPAPPAAAAAGQAPEAPAAEQAQPELPEASMTALISMIGSQAMFSLGAVPDPETKRRYVNLETARFHIETLKVLDEKTAGNLTADEKDLLNRTLYDLRTQFVHIAQRMISI